ncbi:MAG: FAD:protein FMN transferase [Actinomycetota bacterium]|nr:FAD:protein FMN transferase [Actinomycetota bacterium]
MEAAFAGFGEGQPGFEQLRFRLGFDYLGLGQLRHQLTGDDERVVTTASVDWELWTTRASLIVTDPTLLPEATSRVHSYLAAVETAASRFRHDSEVRRLRPGRTRVSPVLADLLGEALAAAAFTSGDVDPTVGEAIRTWGYDRDIRLVRDEVGPPRAHVRRVPGWRLVELHGDAVELPEGIELDLGATAKAVAADRCAALVAELGTGTLVSLGGDIATAGPCPPEGWQVLVQDGEDEPATTLGIQGTTAVATSSTRRRSWMRGGRLVHHIIDPSTGEPADPVWRSVTVAAPTCVMANAVTTACVVRGERAVAWVNALGLPARFVSASGEVRLSPTWPLAVAS